MHRTLHSVPRTARLTLAACAVLLAGTAQAGEFYGQVGFPGAGIGYAQPVSDSVTLRADAISMGTRESDYDEEGITYKGKLKANRVAVFADWFPFGGVFRFTGGLASNKFDLTLDASGSGQQIDVGGTRYTLNAGDGLTMSIKYPRTMPYFGVGWGHQPNVSGLRISFDVGALIGKPKVSATGRGQLANPSAQADIDREVAEINDGIGKVSVLPQFSFSLGYSF
ncbi:hypothetical protein [Leptothrix discophora]|uniref:Outer membrane protein beta-barrel domain-containing protein n=1 Tax=Leptothrix discophora TaxID=89 RepID=A0ABT9G3J6_LEPDI|nr:hypothetical protein [Leptothrix discophora]MDP4301066.1 hypothetical protein [Leptothrix discophora]